MTLDKDIMYWYAAMCWYLTVSLLHCWYQLFYADVSPGIEGAGYPSLGQYDNTTIGHDIRTRREPVCQLSIRVNRAMTKLLHERGVLLNLLQTGAHAQDSLEYYNYSPYTSQFMDSFGVDRQLWMTGSPNALPVACACVNFFSIFQHEYKFPRF